MSRIYKIAVVQPKNLERTWTEHWPVTFDPTTPPESEQLNRAVGYASEAAEGGAHLVVFPELYPGPEKLGGQAFTLEETTAKMCKAAKEFEIWIVFCGKGPDGSGGSFNQLQIAGPDGEVKGVYNKMYPATNEPNTQGTEPPLVLDCGGLKVGFLICWEMWFPEMSRMAAMAGAELIVVPTGGMIYELTAAWRTITEARALENNVYNAICLNTFGVEDGLCQVTGPEGKVAELKGEGVLFAEIDLGRREFMAESEEDIIMPKPYRAVPGLLKYMPKHVVEKYYNVAQEFFEKREQADSPSTSELGG